MADRLRSERDYLGEVKVPSDAYYGVQTERAKQNFPISGLHFPSVFIKNYARIKKAAALANLRAKVLEKKKANAIVKACNEIIAGKFSNQFVVDVYQAGAGTSTNMNLNEVIANRAIEILKGRKGDYKIVHPNDDVNKSQSTNDTFHSAIHMTALEMLEEKLFPALDKMRKVLHENSKKFSKVIKPGRTHLMDAALISLGQEFSGYESAIEANIGFLKKSSELLHQLNIGGTAVGTGLNAPEGFAEMVINEINSEKGSNFKRAFNYFVMTQNTIAELELSSALKSLAVNLIKISNDIRLMNSGPITGFADITIPAVQPGSSIMPGKINPSIPEMLDMVAFQVIGNDLTITIAVQSSQFELNVMMPLIAYNLLSSIEILSNAIDVFVDKTLSGIKPNIKRLSEMAEKDPFIATALVPYIGFEKTAEIIKEVVSKNKSVKEVVLEKGLMSEKELNEILNPKKLVRR